MLWKCIKIMGKLYSVHSTLFLAFVAAMQIENVNQKVLIYVLTKCILILNNCNIYHSLEDWTIFISSVFFTPITKHAPGSSLSSVFLTSQLSIYILNWVLYLLPTCSRWLADSVLLLDKFLSVSLSLSYSSLSEYLLRLFFAVPHTSLWSCWINTVSISSTSHLDYNQNIFWGQDKHCHLDNTNFYNKKPTNSTIHM